MSIYIEIKHVGLLNHFNYVNLQNKASFKISSEKPPNHMAKITAISQEISCKNHTLPLRSAGSCEKKDTLDMCWVGGEYRSIVSNFL